jgi:hypothetical protein
MTSVLLPKMESQKMYLDWTQNDDRPLQIACGSGFGARLGVQFEPFGWAHWRFRGYENLTVDLTFGFEGNVGIGFSFDPGSSMGGPCWNVTICEAFITQKQEFGNYPIGGEMFGCANLGLAARKTQKLVVFLLQGAFDGSTCLV